MEIHDQHLVLTARVCGGQDFNRDCKEFVFKNDGMATHVSDRQVEDVDTNIQYLSRCVHDSMDSKGLQGIKNILDNKEKFEENFNETIQ